MDSFYCYRSRRERGRERDEAVFGLHHVPYQAGAPDSRVRTRCIHLFAPLSLHGIQLRKLLTRPDPTVLIHRKKNAPFILCMTAATMITPLSSPAGLRRRGMGTRCCGASMWRYMIWSSVHTSTPLGPSNLSDVPICPPGTCTSKFARRSVGSLHFLTTWFKPRSSS